MTAAHALTRAYGVLTAEERFRLILAAGGRGDDAERERLAAAGGGITLTLPGHAPYANAFAELAQQTYLDLLESAAQYLDAWGRIAAAPALDGPADDDEPEPEDAEGAAGEAPEVPDERDRLLDLALAAGYVLRAKADGWRLFCDRMTVPPFLLWERLPGFARLQRALALALAERAAFTPEGFVRFINAIRPTGHPEVIELPPALTAEGVAAAAAEYYRERSEWWGG